METLLSSDLCAILFDPLTGCLGGVRDLARDVTLAGTHGRGSPPLGVDGVELSFAGLRLSRSLAGSRLRAGWKAGGLLLDLVVSLGSRSACSTWTLDVTNTTLGEVAARIDFPVLGGTGACLFAGGPECPVPWAALSDPSGTAGLGVIIVQEGGAMPGFTAAGGTVRARLSALAVGPGKRVRAAEARLVACGPGWRDVARTCASWLGRRRGSPPLIVTAGLSADQVLALHLSFPGAALSATDPVTASLAGLPCHGGGEAAGRGPLEQAWACGWESAAPALRGGQVANDPVANDPGIVTRMFRGRHMDAVVCARPPDPGEEGSLADFHAPWEAAIPVREGRAPEVALCDLEDLSWRRLVPLVRGGALRFDTSSNWVLCLLLGPRLRIAGFGPLPPSSPGSSVAVHVEAVAGRGGAPRVRLRAPTMRGRATTRVGSEVRVTVPRDAPPGWHPLWIEGRRTPRFMRFLRVTS